MWLRWIKDARAGSWVAQLKPLAPKSPKIRVNSRHPSGETFSTRPAKPFLPARQNICHPSCWYYDSDQNYDEHIHDENDKVWHWRQFNDFLGDVEQRHDLPVHPSAPGAIIIIIIIMIISMVVTVGMLSMIGLVNMFHNFWTDGPLEDRKISTEPSW